MPELERVPPGRKRGERGREPLVVAREVRRQLPQERAELAKRIDALEEAPEPRLELTQPLDVGDVARDLDREAEAVGCGPLPALDRTPVR